jgi:DNA invertase Pin-like site-specific DNA recombinase
MEQENKKIKIAAYIRVSTRGEKQDISKQREMILNYITSHPEMELYDIFSDEGISGSKSSKPGLDLMLSKIKEYNCVLVYKLDRIGRSMRNLFELMDIFKANNIDFISVTQSIDTTKPEGRLFFNMLNAFSEWERELTVQRVRDGLEVAKSRGVKLGRRKGVKDSKKRSKAGYYLSWQKRKKMYEVKRIKE